MLYFSVSLCFSFILASFEITAVSDVALQSCPTGGEEGGRVQVSLAAHGVLAAFPLMTARAEHTFSPFLSPPCLADHLPANQGWTQFPAAPVAAAAELPGDPRLLPSRGSVCAAPLPRSGSQVEPHWLH